MLSALTHDHKLVQRFTIFNTEEEVQSLHVHMYVLIESRHIPLYITCWLRQRFRTILVVNGSCYILYGFSEIVNKEFIQLSWFVILCTLLVALWWWMTPCNMKMWWNKVILVRCCQQRFLQRFDVLQKVMVPEPMSYIHFKESTRQGHLSVCPMTLNCDLYDAVDICI